MRSDGAQLRAVLDGDDFFKLVNGEEVSKQGTGAAGPVTVRLILSDIGFARMRMLLDAAEKNDA